MDTGHEAAVISEVLTAGTYIILAPLVGQDQDLGVWSMLEPGGAESLRCQITSVSRVIQEGSQQQVLRGIKGMDFRETPFHK